MRSLRILLWIVLVMSVSVPIARAKIAYAYVANHASNDVSAINQGRGVRAGRL